ncbi:MAG: AbrB/MazE/SpoVT family DNA-binding domain-containing protein [bacterium]|nr:AbrB/MazE/SpoVT family DNA-binding domain-containing protein [bacterium]
MADIKIKNQKIIKVGNSYAVTLDKEFIDRTQMAAGSQLIAKYDEDTASVQFAAPATYAAAQGKPLQLAEKKAVYASKVTPELEKWTENFLKENQEALEKLANL